VLILILKNERNFMKISAKSFLLLISLCISVGQAMDFFSQVKETLEQLQPVDEDKLRNDLKITADIGNFGLLSSSLGYLSRFGLTRKVAVPLEVAGNCVLACTAHRLADELPKLKFSSDVLNDEQRKYVKNCRKKAVSGAIVARSFFVGRAAGLLLPEAVELLTELGLNQKYYRFCKNHRDLLAFCSGCAATALLTRRKKAWSTLFGLLPEE